MQVAATSNVLHGRFISTRWRCHSLCRVVQQEGTVVTGVCLSTEVGGGLMGRGIPVRPVAEGREKGPLDRT